MQWNIKQTCEANLSEVEAILDALANPPSPRKTSTGQAISKLIIESPFRSPLVMYAGESIRIGRSAECELSIPQDQRVSKVHCTIECDTGRALLSDLQSTNGTFLNGNRIRTASLFDADRILIGSAILVVRIKTNAT